MTQEEFKIIFDTYFDIVRNYIYYRSGDTELATDIAQETFMKIWEKQLYAESQKMKGLLFKISNDIFISNYRRKILAINYTRSLNLNTEEENTEQALHYKELKKNYEHLLAVMPEKQRIVFLMNRMDEMKYSEIAAHLNISIKAVEKRMKHALNFLKKELNRS